MMTHSSREFSAERKARGAFFTPPDLSDFIAAWAIRSSKDRILEPSCGEAAFLISSVHRLRSLQKRFSPPRVYGMDIHADSAILARDLLKAEGADADIQVGDFFAIHPPQEKFDAVVGNPPYVRYQSFAGEARARALESALRQGVRLNGLASSWAAFTVHASAFLKPEGRLGLVLPAELLSVNYAAEIRRFLLKRFANVRLVLFEELVFPGVLEEVVLLLAEGFGGSNRFEVFQAKNSLDLPRATGHVWTGYSPVADEKWTSALLSSEAIKQYREVTTNTGFETLQNWGNTYLGAVTGNNNFFAISQKQAQLLRLPERELEPISPPGSRHLKGLALSEAAWAKLRDDGQPCFLFVPSEKPSAAAERYIEKGERENVHKAYKCRVRSPWWRVPLVLKPDFLFSYMNHDRPRIVRNSANVHLLNSLYGVRLHASRRKLGQELLHIASLNSLTLLGSEIVGRSYGGGMLKHEPKEADLLPMPSLDALAEAGPRLKLLQPQISAAMRRPDISPAIEMVDRILLKDVLGVTSAQIDTFRSARKMLFQRRITRGKGLSGED